jgi:hypothetical protein
LWNADRTAAVLVKPETQLLSPSPPLPDFSLPARGGLSSSIELAPMGTTLEFPLEVL